jgi:lactate dehydrogenase-like 2-hydroxyacid dehydrogenase
VILDEVELSDEQYRRLESLGTVATFDSNPADDEETVARAQDADVLVLGWTTLRAGVLTRLGRLKMISIWATGYDYVDVRAARERGVVTTNVPAYAGHAVAELTIGLLISLARQIVPADRHVRGASTHGRASAVLRYGVRPLDLWVWEISALRWRASRSAWA